MPLRLFQIHHSRSPPTSASRRTAMRSACVAERTRWPVGVLIDAIASLLEVHAGELRADLLPAVRELVFTGFLRFAD